MNNLHLSGILAAASLAALGYHSTAQAQSFSCAKARVSAEYEICNNEDLLVRDEKLAILYRKASRAAKTPGQKSGLKRSQLIWVGERNHCKIDSKCIAKTYSARAEALENFASDDLIPAPHQPPAQQQKKAGFWTGLMRGGPAFGPGFKDGIKLQ